MARPKGRKPLTDLQVAARDAANARSGLTRPLKMEDLAPHEQEQAIEAISSTTKNLPEVLMKEGASKTATWEKKKRGKAAEAEEEGEQEFGEGPKGSDPGARYRRAAEHPDLRVEAADPDAMTSRLVGHTVEAATGAQRRHDEPLAGLGFYFGHHGKLVNPLSFKPSYEQLINISEASSRLSPRNNPNSEARTASALMDAHQGGRVRLTEGVVTRLSKGYKDASGKKQAGIQIDEGIKAAAKANNGWVPFAHLPGNVVDHMRKRDNADMAHENSEGVDWEGLRSTGMGKSVIAAHHTLQEIHGLRGGDWKTSARPDPFKNPKQWGYSRSIAHSSPEEMHEYMRIAHHVGGVLRGEIDPHSWRDSGPVPEHSILSPRHAIAGDMWHRAATFGQPLDIASTTAQIFHGTKGYMRRNPLSGEPEEVKIAHNDTRVTAVGLEHALQQHVTERAAMELGRRVGIHRGIPSVMLQETTWANIRRAAGGDAAFNEYRRLNGNQFHQIDASRLR